MWAEALVPTPMAAASTTTAASAAFQRLDGAFLRFTSSLGRATLPEEKGPPRHPDGTAPISRKLSPGSVHVDEAVAAEPPGVVLVVRDHDRTEGAVVEHPQPPAVPRAGRADDVQEHRPPLRNPAVKRLAEALDLHRGAIVLRACATEEAHPMPGGRCAVTEPQAHADPDELGYDRAGRTAHLRAIAGVTRRMNGERVAAVAGGRGGESRVVEVVVRIGILLQHDRLTGVIVHRQLAAES